MNNIHVTLNNKFLTYILSAVLFVFPIHLVFIFLKNFLYDSGIFKAKKVDAKVISIGNIALGGTGKTPTTVSIANFLERKGFSVGIVTRGHGRQNIKNSFLLKNHSWRECGDEVILLKNNTSLSTHIFVSLDKVYAAKQLSSMGCNIILLDDGFQHRRFHRDVDIVLLGPENQNKRRQFVYPYGLLREPFSCLKRADITIATKSNLVKAKNLTADHNLSLEVKEEVLSSGSVKNIHDLGSQPGLMSVCSIGDPESFSKTLNSIDINVDKELIFPDHWPFDLNDIEKINGLASKENLKHVVCTEKDFVKLLEFKNSLDIDICAVVMKHQLSDEIEQDILSRLA
jgi:tetraacyldisaccharide 4'-kinase|tara:strand:+ start:907 stop:1932 length:1026 start_codon:yes stop_codon:yes gene_type:complete